MYTDQHIYFLLTAGNGKMQDIHSLILPLLTSVQIYANIVHGDSCVMSTSACHVACQSA